MRLAASLSRAVNAVWTMNGALYSHFCRASEDTELNSNGRCMFEGLATKHPSGDFIKNMGLMFDALEVLKRFF